MGSTYIPHQGTDRKRGKVSLRGHRRNAERVARGLADAGLAHLVIPRQVIRTAVVKAVVEQ